MFDRYAKYWHNFKSSIKNFGEKSRTKKMYHKEASEIYNGVNLRCYNGCNRWAKQNHELGYPSKLEKVNVDVLSLKCGYCDAVSYFNTSIAPVAIACDEKGSPLEYK